MDKKIFWNIINSALAGALVLLGALTDGEITLKGLYLAIVAGSLVAFSQFKDFWKEERDEVCKTLGTFIIA